MFFHETAEARESSAAEDHRVRAKREVNRRDAFHQRQPSQRRCSRRHGRAMFGIGLFSGVSSEIVVEAGRPSIPHVATLAGTRRILPTLSGGMLCHDRA